MKAWHFLKENGRCGNGRLGIVEVGKTYKVKGEIEPCYRGLHASVRLIDALQYAPGPILCRVEMGGTIVKRHDKVAASERTVIWMQDISETLHLFACSEAERALKARKVTDPRSWNAIKVKRKWLRGEATDAELDAARDAASAARDAASAASAAARDAAWAAAWAAASAAAWDAQNKRLAARVRRLMK